MAKVKNVMITLTSAQIDKLEELSEELFGKINKSAYLQILIEKEHRKLMKSREE